MIDQYLTKSEYINLKSDRYFREIADISTFISYQHFVLLLHFLFLD